MYSNQGLIVCNFPDLKEKQPYTRKSHYAPFILISTKSKRPSECRGNIYGL